MGVIDRLARLGSIRLPSAGGPGPGLHSTGCLSVLPCPPRTMRAPSPSPCLPTSPPPRPAPRRYCRPPAGVACELAQEQPLQQRVGVVVPWGHIAADGVQYLTIPLK